MKVHRLHRFAEMRHALAQFALNAPAFLLAHLVQAIKRFADPRHYRRFKSSIVRLLAGFERARNSQNRIEVRFGGQ